MSPDAANPDLTFEAFAAALHRGDFSWLAPMFEGPPEGSRVAEWVEEGRFAPDPAALHEAASCACFLGRTPWVSHLVERGADPIAGAETGLNGFHWAANRGQLETVRALIARGYPMEIRNHYGGTVLGTAVWSAIHEPRPDHLAIIEALLMAGARVEEAEYPSGSDSVDALLRRFRAS